MFKTRLLSGIVLVALALLFIILGGPVLLCVMGVISIIGMFELYRVLSLEKTPLAYTGYVFAVLYYANLYFDLVPHMLIAMAYLVVLLGVYVFSYPKYKAHDLFGVFFGLFYVAFCLSYVYQTRMMDRGAYIVWLIFLCSWGCDTCAYCVGVLFGKHKMAPY